MHFNSQSYFCSLLLKNMALKQIITTLFILMMLRIVAQDTANVSVRSSVVFRFIPEQEPSPDNFMIKEIARYNFLNLQKTRIIETFDLKIQIIRKDEKMLVVRSNLNVADVSGDVFYKEFGLKDVLVPEFFAYRINVVSKEDTIAGYLVENVRPGRVRIDTLKPFATSDAEELTYVVSGVSSGFTGRDINRFETRISAINDYLAISRLSSYQLEKARKTDPENSENIFSCFLKVCDLERYVKLTHEMLDNIGFEIPQQHTVFLQDNLKKLNSRLRRFNTLMAQKAAKSVAVANKQMLAAATDTLVALQLGYLHELDRQTFYFDSVYRRLATFFDAEHSPEDFDVKANGVFEGSVNLKLFWEILTDSYIRSADSLMSLEKYHEAVVLLKSAESACGFTGDENGALTVYHKLSTAKWGIYDAYLRVAQKAMDAGNTDMAGRYIKKAETFQQANQGFIVTNGYTLDAYEKLAWLCFEQGDIKFGEENFLKALSDYSEALQIYRMLKINRYDDVLKRKIEKSAEALR